MKPKYLLIMVALMFCLYACKESVTRPTDKTSHLSLLGKWNLLKDSTSAGAGQSQYFISYSGKPGDYFDFRSNGYLYTKEGPKLDTLSYDLLSDSTVIIQSFVYVGSDVPHAVAHFKPLGADGTAVYLPWVISPGGAFGRAIILSR